MRTQFALLAVSIFLTSAQPASAAPTCRSVFAAQKPVAPKDVLIAALAIHDGMNPMLLSHRVVAELKRITGVKRVSQLSRPNELHILFVHVAKQLGPDGFELALGNRLASVRDVLNINGTEKQDKNSLSDLHDMNRGWGWRLLPENDPAFSEPRYLAQLLKESGAGGQVQSLRSQNGREIQGAFYGAWEKVAPKNTRPEIFALTGSDANNLLYDIARQYTNDRSYDAEILVFQGAYGAARGRLTQSSLLYGRRSNNLLTSPTTPILNPKDAREISQLKLLEEQALNEIRSKVLNAQGPQIGGVFIEPIQGANRVLFYRPEFMLQLRKLCDELRIPIFADEILTGGGRTGKFFAYQHYPGFEPDYVTFGKGLQVAGIATVTRSDRPLDLRQPYISDSVTLRQTNEALLKSTQVLNRIHNDRLMENAESVGAYFVQRLSQRHQKQRALHRAQLRERLKAAVAGFEPRKLELEKLVLEALVSRNTARDKEALEKWRKDQIEIAELKIEQLKAELSESDEKPRGIGVLIYSPDTSTDAYVMDARGRLMPPLTITRKEVDSLFTD